MQPTASHPQGKGCRLLTATVVVAAAMLETRTAAVTRSKVMSEEALGPTSGSVVQRGRKSDAASSCFSLLLLFFLLREEAAEGLISRVGGNGTFSMEEAEGDRRDGGEGESVDKSAETEREEGRQAGRLFNTDWHFEGGGRVTATVSSLQQGNQPVRLFPYALIETQPRSRWSYQS